MAVRTLGSKDAAIARFVSFHERRPTTGEIQLLEAHGKEFTLSVGQLFGISYCVPEENKPYFHEFKASNRPLLVVSADGLQAYILKGGYKFTDRGFVG